ncbi:MAG: thiamine phosphate synthase [Pyrinomonadaceae bacterium]|nr:thiamine phosphate synthase [Pyrinomonadaceae bacterium]
MSSTFMRALAGTRLYPLTDRYLSRLSHAEQVSHLGKAGARIVQLREKLLPPFEFYQEAANALRVARQLGIKVLINDRVDIALALKVDGVHLGQGDLPPEAARRLLGPKAMIGVSTHNPEQARLAAKMHIDYIAIGPIFATSTKQASETPTGLTILREVRHIVGQIPLVAIGGITSENSQDVLDAGADAVAVISDIWSSPGTVADARALL